MPRDPFGIRTPSFRAKINQLKGVSADEKALLVRVSNIIDTFTLAQKQSANPRGQRRIFSNAVPGPANVTIVGITGGIQISWDPVVIPIDFYEVQISNSSSFASTENFQVVANTRMSFRAPPGTDSLFVRIRTVTKKGEVSNFTATVSITLIGASLFQPDQDMIEPENRTSVSPKPTLLGSAFTTNPGDNLFLGVGAYIGPSPLTLDNSNNGYSANVNIRHEVSYTAFEETTPYPGYEQRLGPTIGEYIDVDDFYTYSPSFYNRFAILPNTISDFFNEIDIDGVSPSTTDVEFLRYRIVGTFYNPNFNQTGITLSATLGAIKF